MIRISSAIVGGIVLGVLVTYGLAQTSIWFIPRVSLGMLVGAISAFALCDPLRFSAALGLRYPRRLLGALMYVKVWLNNYGWYTVRVFCLALAATVVMAFLSVLGFGILMSPKLLIKSFGEYAGPVLGFSFMATIVGHIHCLLMGKTLAEENTTRCLRRIEQNYCWCIVELNLFMVLYWTFFCVIGVCLLAHRGAVLLWRHIHADERRIAAFYATVFGSTACMLFYWSHWPVVLSCAAAGALLGVASLRYSTRIMRVSNHSPQSR